MSLDYWVPKDGAEIITMGRMGHALVGAAVSGLLFWWKGYRGLGASVLGVPALAWAWESATNYLAPLAGWAHPFGDVLDAYAFSIGSAILAVPLTKLALRRRGKETTDGEVRKAEGRHASARRRRSR